MGFVIVWRKKDRDLRRRIRGGESFAGADLRGADLSEACAIATDFGDAALAGADVTGIIFDQEQRGRTDSTHRSGRSATGTVGAS